MASKRSDMKGDPQSLGNGLAVGRMGIWELALASGMAKPPPMLDALLRLEPKPSRHFSDYLRLVHPDDLPFVEELLWGVPIHFQAEWRMCPLGNRPPVWLTVSGERVWDDASGGVLLRGVVADVSSFKRTEQALRARTAGLEARVRRLACLQSVARVLQRDEELGQLLQSVVREIPTGFHDPAGIGVRLTWSKRTFTTPVFVPRPTVLSYELKVRGKVFGQVEIHRVSGESEAVFTPDEQAFVQAIVRSISRTMENDHVARALAESEDRWHAITGALAEGVLMYDARGRLVVCNRSAREMLGDRIAGAQPWQLIEGLGQAIREDGSDYPLDEHPVLVSLRTGKACTDVHIGLRKENKPATWFRVNSRPLFRAGQAKPYGVVVSFKDVTDRKNADLQALRALREKELERSRLNVVLEALPVGVYIADASGKILQINKAAEQLWGAALLPRGPERYHEDYPARWADSGRMVGPYEWGLARSVAHGESVMGEEMEIKRADGTWRSILNYSLPILDGEGRIAGGVEVSVDITDRKHSEGERGLLAAIAQASSDAIISTDIDGRITSWNSGAERMYGYQAEEILGESISRLLPPERGDEFGVVLGAVQEGKGVTHFDSSRVHKSGEQIDVSVSITPVTDAAGRVRGIAKIDRDISDRKRMEARLQYEAMHDRLTGAANRSLFRDRLEHVVKRAARFGERFAVCMLDLDDFKGVNDTYGHQVGDHLLVAFVERIQALLRPVDTVARFGGDEFVLLLEEVTDQKSVERVARRILSSLKRPFMLDGHEITVSSSIGIMLGDSSCRSADEAIRGADFAAYRAKRQGKSRFVVYDVRMRGDEVSRLYLEQELREAVQTGSLTVEYQPIVDLVSRRAIGCEALIRWHHAVMGAIAPQRLIRVAEETGLIMPLGRFVIERACSSMAEWRQLPGFSSDFYVSVNVSSKEFYARDLIPFLEGTLQRHGLDGESLRLEITERALFKHDEEAADILHKLQDLGIRTCLDDFGTGYSPFGYLDRLPLDVIKVDRSFVERVGDGIQSREVVRSIVDLARALDLQAVAEGVETPEQLAHLGELGFQWAQGYALYRPMDQSAMGALFGASGDGATSR